MQLIPEDFRDRNIPCRYIPLNESGETIESFYLTGTQEEQESAVAHWLKTTIQSWSETHLDDCRVRDLHRSRWTSP
jgi:hypothetical protein